MQTVGRVADNAVDDNDKRAGGTAYLHLAATQGGDDETSHDGGNDALFGCYAAGNTECNGQGQGHDADDDTGHQVLHETFLVVAFQRVKQTRLQDETLHNLCVFSSLGCTETLRKS